MSFGDIFGDSFDLLKRTWKPLLLGFLVFNVVGAIPMWAWDFGQSRLYEALSKEESPGMQTLTRMLPTFQLILGLGFVALLLWVLAYNFAIAMAQSAFMSKDPENVGEVTAFSFKLFFPAMGSLGWFGLVYLVPIFLFCWAIYQGVQAFNGGSILGSVLLFVVAVGVRLLCAPFMYLTAIVPVAIGTQGRTAFSRALSFVRENVGEMLAIAFIFIGIAIGTSLVQMLLEAPLPTVDSGPQFKDLIDAGNMQNIVEKMLKPAAVPVWVTVLKQVIDILTNTLSQGFCACLIGTWFAVRSGLAPEAWPKIKE